MSRVKVEGVCLYYDQAGGRCLFPGINYSIEQRAERENLAIDEQRDGEPSLSEGSRKKLHLGYVFNPGSSSYDVKIIPKSYLCQVRGSGGSIFSRTVEVQQDCTTYQPGPQRTVRIRA